MDRHELLEKGRGSGGRGGGVGWGGVDVDSLLQTLVGTVLRLQTRLALRRTGGTLGGNERPHPN